jgi:hypothetical protein
LLGALAQDEAGALAREQDVLEQVLLVDAGPDVEGLGAGPRTPNYWDSFAYVGLYPLVGQRLPSGCSDCDQ